VRGRRDDSKRRGQRRIVLGRQQRRHEDQIGNAVADGREGELGRFRQNELRPHALSDDMRQVRRLAAIGFDDKNQRHPTFST
jgi:hypothetical protein